MKRLIYLFLTLFTAVAYGQADFPEGVQISGGQPTTTTDPYITTTGATGLQGKVPPINMPVTITPPTTFYTPVTSDLKGHLQGIDNALGDIPLTTAGNTTRVWFTGDATTITAGTFYLTNAQNKGTVANVSQSVTNDDNQKKYFTQDLIGNAFATTTIFPPGVYAGNLSASTTPNSAQQRFTVELYRCDTNGTPIASGIAGAPVGDLGVTVILILDSGLLTLADGSVTNVQVSASLASQLTVNVGERIRYHVSAEKVGTVASNITESVWYGSSFNSFLDVPTPITSSGVTNDSTVTGATVTVALDNLKASDQLIAGTSVPYGHITDGVQTIAGGKSFDSQVKLNDGTLLFPSIGFYGTEIGSDTGFNHDQDGEIEVVVNANRNLTFNSSSITSFVPFIRNGVVSTDALLAGGSTLSNPVSGTGTATYIPKWTTSGIIGNSSIYDNGGNVGINNSTANRPLVINGAFAENIVLNSTNAFSGIAFNSSGTTFSPMIGGRTDSVVIQTNGSDRLIIGSTGAVNVSNLSGTGTRTVVADASGNLSATAAVPLRYVALISQSGTSAPTATVLENTLGGTVTWNRVSSGHYTANSSGLFTVNKTIIFTATGTPNTSLANQTISQRALNVNTVEIYPRENGSAGDNMLSGTSIEIRVYP